MAVHAHPDDEAIGTGGILSRYAREGVRTVLVTCTNGELGDAPGGTKPDHDSHDEPTVVATRRAELEAACRILGVGDLELLGYRDSGMMGWPQNAHPDAFWNVPVADAAARVAALMERYRPHVVVTYDENGFYGHPDHIQAHRVTLAAAESTRIPRKLYYATMGRSAMRTVFEALRASGADPGSDEADPPGVDDERITTVVDVSAAVDAKLEAIAAHASQGDSAFFMQVPRDLLRAFFSHETFERRLDTTGAPLPENDLFAGLRDER